MGWEENRQVTKGQPRLSKATEPSKTGETDHHQKGLKALSGEGAKKTVTGGTRQGVWQVWIQERAEEDVVHMWLPGKKN